MYELTLIHVDLQSIVFFSKLYRPLVATYLKTRPFQYAAAIKCPFFKGGSCHVSRGTQRIVSINYLFGGPLIPSDFLQITVTSNFRDMRNANMSVVFQLLKLTFWVQKKGQLSVSEKL